MDWNSYFVRVRFVRLVALLVSAWIEIHLPKQLQRTCLVALLVSAWIEIAKIDFKIKSKTGRTPRECVDWNRTIRIWQRYWYGRTPRECVDWNWINGIYHCIVISRTPRECVDWNIKTFIFRLTVHSRTPRECVDWNFLWLSDGKGWKSRTPRECVDWNISLNDTTYPSGTSHSSWVRGLKWLSLYFWFNTSVVALLVSAWIEIGHSAPGLSCRLVALLVSAWIEMKNQQHEYFWKRRTPRECVDWNRDIPLIVGCRICRTPRECVDWNPAPSPQCQATKVALLVSAWIEIGLCPFRLIGLRCRTPRECVDWNIWSQFIDRMKRNVALLVSAWIEIHAQKRNTCCTTRWIGYT